MAFNFQNCRYVFQTWNTFIKLAWEVPRSTHTNLVEDFFAKDFLSVRNQVLSRYVTFFQSLLTSPSREIRILVRIIMQDHQSVMRLNVDHVTELSGLSPWDYDKKRIQMELPKPRLGVNDMWRVSLLTNLLEQRTTKSRMADDAASIQAWIDSICST